MDHDVSVAMDELGKMKRKMKRKIDSRARIASDLGQFYGLTQILELVPVSRTTIYNMIADGEFPQQIKLGKRSVVWSKSVVDAWIREKLCG